MSLDPVSKLIKDLEGSFESRETLLVFRNRKKELKEKAKNDELSQEQRDKVLAILQKVKGTSSTNILFACPRIWKILKRPSDYPAETELVKGVNGFAMAAFTRWLSHPATSPPMMRNNDVIDLVYLIKSLKILEIGEYSPSRLNEDKSFETISLDVEHFYKLCSILPNHQFKPPQILGNLLEGVEIPAEYDLFSEIQKNPDAIKKDFPAEKLLRFYLFIKGESNKVLEQLLEHLKSGKLGREYAPTIISTARSNSASTELLHRDKITIALGDLGETTCSLWPFFLKSELIQNLAIGEGEMRVILDGNMARAFPLFYRTCIKGASLPTITASSLDDLRGIWDCFAYFQIEDPKFKQKFFEIINGLPLQTAHHLLIELYRAYPDDDLRKLLFSFLELPFLKNVASKGAGRVDFHTREMPHLVDLQRGIEIIKAVMSENSTLNVFLQDPESFYLFLCAAYYCEELGLQEHKKGYEEAALYLEDSSYFFDSRGARGGVLDAAHILIKTGEPLRLHLHTQLKKMESPPKRWLYACEWAEGKTPKSLAEEEEMFKEFVERGKPFPASLLPSFLYHIGGDELFKKAFEACLKNQDDSFNFPLLQHVVEDCKTLYGTPANFLDTMQISVPQQIPLSLLLKMKGAPRMFYDGSLKELPSKAVQEAIVLLDKLTSPKNPAFNPEDVRSLSPDHFKALELLQEGFVDDATSKIEFSTRLAKLAELIPEFPKECLPAAGAWAYPHNSYFFNLCSEAYCGKNIFESYDARLRLYSISEESLKMLAAMDLKGQHHLVLKDVEVSDVPKVAKACPNLENMVISRKNSDHTLEELQDILTCFKKLKKCEFLIRSARVHRFDLGPFKSLHCNLEVDGGGNPTPNPELPTFYFRLCRW